MSEVGIRGHHLDYLLKIDQTYMQYEQAGASHAEARSIADQQITIWMHDILWDMTSLGERDPVNKEYYIDVVGRDKRAYAKIANNFARALLGIYHLSHDQVEIHSERDGVCRACAIGHHCEENTYEFERQYMKDIIHYATQLGISFSYTSKGSIEIGSQDLREILRTMNESDDTFTYSNESII